jgi:hypothetical protein
VRCRGRDAEEVVKCYIWPLRCQDFVAKAEDFMVCSWSTRTVACGGMGNYLLWSRRPPAPGKCRALPLAATTTASCLLAIRCPDIRCEARVFGLCGCCPKTWPNQGLGALRIACGCAAPCGLDLAVAWDENHLSRHALPRIQVLILRFSRPTSSPEDDHSLLISLHGGHPRSVEGRWQSRAQSLCECVELRF